MNISKAENIYKKLDSLFINANNKYNAGLFLPEEWLSKLIIEDKILINIINELYYPECPYEFSILPIEILGNIYEQFLGKTIKFRNVKEGHTAIIEEKPEVRKAGGVYYTPQYIVNYIVLNTVGEKIKDKKPEEIAKIKILDPACGSGSFLVGAYTYLLNYHIDFYSNEKNIKKALKEEKIYQISEKNYKLTIEEKQKILLNNIFGVDIDPQAVEVTKLSLYLKLLENESVESKDYLFKHSDTKLLPSLDKNIKCGNSLIGSDFYNDKNMSLFGNDDMRKVNVFDWEKEFKEVFTAEAAENAEKKVGGFDVVIGNPPYVRSDTIEVDIKNYLNIKYISAIKQYDIYVLFIEKGIKLLKNSGLFSYIVSNKFLISDYGIQIRKFILENTKFKQAIDVSYDKVFSQASVYPYIVVFEKENNNEIRNLNDILFCDKFINGNNLNFKNRKQIDFYKNEYHFDFSTIGNIWVDKMDNESILLGDLSNITRGFRPPPEKLLVNENDSEKFIIGKDIKTAYFHQWDNNYVKYETSKIPESKPIEIFKKEKIFFRDIGLKFLMGHMIMKDCCV